MTLKELFWPWGSLTTLKREHEALQREHARLTDRDERGRYVRR